MRSFRDTEGKVAAAALFAVSAAHSRGGSLGIGGGGSGTLSIVEPGQGARYELIAALFPGASG